MNIKITERTLSLKLRARILIHLANSPLISPTYSELRTFLGCNSYQTCQHHVQSLAHDGLVELTGGKRGILITDLGLKLAKMLEAYAQPDTLLEKTLKSKSKSGAGVILRSTTRKVSSEAEKIDTWRTNSNRNGLNRFDETKKAREPECKVSNSQILQAMRAHLSEQSAAQSLGISRRALRSRIARLSQEQPTHAN